MYELAGHSFAPWLIVQQKVVHPSQQAPPPQSGQLITDWADTGRVAKRTGATAMAEPMTAARARNPRREVRRSRARAAARASRWVIAASPTRSAAVPPMRPRAHH